MQEQTNGTPSGQQPDLNDPARDVSQTGDAGKGAADRTPGNADQGTVSDEEMESFDDDPNIPTE